MPDTKTEKTPGPGDPGYYNPPTPPKVAEPQNPPPPQTAAAVADFPPDQPQPETATKVDYNDMTVAELKDLANKRGVELHSDMLKDDIIKALKKAE
jgi:Rho termination factor, N-terminal domain